MCPTYTRELCEVLLAVQNFAVTFNSLNSSFYTHFFFFGSFWFEIIIAHTNDKQNEKKKGKRFFFWFVCDVSVCVCVRVCAW